MSDLNNLSQPDYLWGAKSIAAYLGLSERQVRYAEERRKLPIGRLGGKLYASRATLDKFLAAQLPMMEAAHG